MKLEKREISLNEFDSLQDAFTIEKTLLHEYVNALPSAVRKQTRNQLIATLQTVCDDMFSVLDLLCRTRTDQY